MNKLFTKAAKILVGLSLAAGVGVAVGSKKASRADAAIPSGNELLFTINFKDNGTDSSTALTTSTFYSNGITSVTDKNGNTVTSTFSSAGVDSTNKCYAGTGGLKCGSNKNAADFTLNIPSAYQTKFTYVVINCTNATRDITLTAGGGSDTLSSGNSSFGDHELNIDSTSNATTLTVSIASASKTAAYIASIAVYKATAGAASVTGVSVTGTSSKTSYTTVDAWSNAGLTATVTMSDSSPYTGSINWAFTPDLTPAAAVLANSNNEVIGYSLTATASAGGQSGSKTTTNVSVSYATVAQGSAAVPNANDEIDGVIVRGIVSYVDDVDTTTYHNATYYISDDGTRSSEIEVYHGKGVANADITNVNDIKVGDIVLVYGNLKYASGNWGSQKEFLQGNYLLDLDRPASTNPSITITDSSFTMSLGDADVAVHATAENIPEGGSVAWESSDTDVATISYDSVNEVYEVHAEGLGTATITASILNSSSVSVADNSITVTVVSCPIHVGDEIYFYAEYSSTTYYMSAVGQTSSSTESEKVIFTVESGSAAGSFSFKNGSDYLKCTSSSPYLGSGEDKDSTTSWTVVDNGSEIIITSVSTTTRSIMWNLNSPNTPRFGAYTSTSATILRVQIGTPAVPTYVTLNKASLTLENGASETLTYTTDEYAVFTWVSSEESVATVDNTGLVECVANSGTTVIRIFYDSDKDGAYDVGEPTSTCTVTAAPAQVHFGDSNYGGVGTLITSDTGLNGKNIIFGRGANTVVSGALDGNIINYHTTDEEAFGVVYDSTNHKFTIGNGRSDTHITVFTINSMTGGYSFSTKVNGETKYLVETAVKKLGYSDEAQAWTITYTAGEARVTSSSGNILRYNTGTPRFTTYASTTTSGVADVELYEFYSYYEEATEYAELFIKGDVNNTCAETIENWDDLGDLFDLLSSGAQNIFKIATHLASETYTTANEYTVEHAVARYDDALLKHTELRDNEFMGRVAEGTLSYNNPKVALVSFVVEKSNTVAIIIVISMVSVTAIGGYFFLKKRREQN